MLLRKNTDCFSVVQGSLSEQPWRFPEFEATSTKPAHRPASQTGAVNELKRHVETSLAVVGGMLPLEPGFLGF